MKACRPKYLDLSCIYALLGMDDNKIILSCFEKLRHKVWPRYLNVFIFPLIYIEILVKIKSNLGKINPSLVMLFLI